MCVILIAEEKRLTKKVVEAAIAANPDGNGFAYIDKGAVVFTKGVSDEDAIVLARTLPMPYVFHARIATVGGICPELCHPFAIDGRVKPGALDGRSRRGVLFHNGTWWKWRDFVEQGDGAWSDSRAMATMVSAYGADTIEECVNEDQNRVVLFTPKGIQRFGRGWSQPVEGVWASNTHFLRSGCLHVRPQADDDKGGDKQQRLIWNLR